MKITININTDNSVFYCDDDSFNCAEVDRILQETIVKIQKNDEGSCRDINGNRVGSFKVERELGEYDNVTIMYPDSPNYE